jgi:hypothetical protein
MRSALSIVALFLLTRCSSFSDYDPNTGSNTSLLGNQGTSGVQTSIWSDDPNKATIVNQRPSQ